MTGAEVSGPALFARYAYPPNELGYCGTDDPSVLLSQAGGRGRASSAATSRDRDMVRQFDGAWPYLEAIARGTEIGDPLDPRVIEAYWLGGALLDSVSPGDLLEHLRSTFGTRNNTGLLPDLDSADRLLAHHSFHVLAVYPWVRLLRTRGRVPLSVLQNCRIRWGEVTDVGEEHADVLSAPLVFDGNHLGSGDRVIERVRWNIDGTSLAPAPVRGDVVTMHWDWVCDRITAEQSSALDVAEGAALAIVNRWFAHPDR